MRLSSCTVSLTIINMRIMKVCSTLLIGIVIGKIVVAQDDLAVVNNGLTKNIIAGAGTELKTYNIYQRMQTHHVNGVSIAIINNGAITALKTYGIKDAGNPADSVTTQTLFQLASIGKVITAMAALHLVRENKIGLDQDVNEKLTSWKIPGNEMTAAKKVTLRTLLSHSAGFTDDYGFEGYLPHAELPTTAQILTGVKPANNRKKLVSQTIPGTVEKYSGGGYIIIQQLIEDLTHQSFSDYVDSIIFRRLQMNNTTFDYYPDENGRPIARGHDSDGKIDRKRKYHVYPERAAAGPWTTPQDVALLIIELQKEVSGVSDLILNASLANEMMKPQINSMGLGPHLAGSEKPLAFWHSGNTAGYVCLAYGLLQQGQGAVIMTNSDQGEWLSLEIMRSIANAYHWPVMQTKMLKTLTAEECATYAGTYEVKNNQVEIIQNSDPGITFKNATQSFKLLPLADGQFTISGSEDRFRLVFEKDSNGAITGFRIMQNGAVVNAVFEKQNAKRLTQIQL
ncbi:MAG: serine hydrolase domain-containing protein [Chitinophagaceae bacterium]